MKRLILCIHFLLLFGIFGFIIPKFTGVNEIVAAGVQPAATDSCDFTLITSMNHAGIEYTSSCNQSIIVNDVAYTLYPTEDGTVLHLRTDAVSEEPDNIEDLYKVDESGIVPVNDYSDYEEYQISANTTAGQVDAPKPLRKWKPTNYVDETVYSSPDLSLEEHTNPVYVRMEYDAETNTFSYYGYKENLYYQNMILGNKLYLNFLTSKEYDSSRIPSTWNDGYFDDITMDEKPWFGYWELYDGTSGADGGSDATNFEDVDETQLEWGVRESWLTPEAYLSTNLFDDSFRAPYKEIDGKKYYRALYTFASISDSDNYSFFTPSGSVGFFLDPDVMIEKFSGRLYNENEAEGYNLSDGYWGGFTYPALASGGSLYADGGVDDLEQIRDMYNDIKDDDLYLKDVTEGEIPPLTKLGIAIFDSYIPTKDIDELSNGDYREVISITGTDPNNVHVSYENEIKNSEIKNYGWNSAADSLFYFERVPLTDEEADCVKDTYGCEYYDEYISGDVFDVSSIKQLYAVDISRNYPLYVSGVDELIDFATDASKPVLYKGTIDDSGNLNTSDIDVTLTPDRWQSYLSSYNIIFSGQVNSGQSVALANELNLHTYDDEDGYDYSRGNIYAVNFVPTNVGMNNLRLQFQDDSKNKSNILQVNVNVVCPGDQYINDAGVCENLPPFVYNADASEIGGNPDDETFSFAELTVKEPVSRSYISQLEGTAPVTQGLLNALHLNTHNPETHGTADASKVVISRKSWWNTDPGAKEITARYEGSNRKVTVNFTLA